MVWGIDKPLKVENIYNIDTGASKGGKLTIMDVESKQFWQSE
jgi:serine/threonine protein phosphatase 1